MVLSRCERSISVRISRDNSASSREASEISVIRRLMRFTSARTKVSSFWRVASAVEMLVRAPDEATRQKLLTLVRADVKRINRLITDISDASRLDAELSREMRTEIDLSHLLRTIVEIYDVTERNKNVAVTLDDTLPAGTKVMGHDERLGQVFRNLIDNAISFAPEGGTIAIAAHKHHAFTRITVEDNGPGIPPDNLESIFERFYTCLL